MRADISVPVPESNLRGAGLRLQKDYDMIKDYDMAANGHAVIDSSDDETSSGGSTGPSSPASEQEECRRARQRPVDTARGGSKSSTVVNASTKDGSRGGWLDPEHD